MDDGSRAFALNIGYFQGIHQLLISHGGHTSIHQGFYSLPADFCDIGNPISVHRFSIFAFDALANWMGRSAFRQSRIIGVNNRNLKDFSVDTGNSAKLRALIPQDVLFVSESGVSTPQDVDALRKIGADAVLVGETLMRAANKKEKLAWLKGMETGEK